MIFNETYSHIIFKIPVILVCILCLVSIICIDTGDAKTANDPEYSINQNALKHANVESAWDITTGSDEVYVCVVDSAFQINHIDLKDNYYTGINIADNSNRIIYPNNHGTMVFGVLGAKGGNNEGIAGTMWDTRVICVQYPVDGSLGDKLTDKIIDGIQWAINQGASIVSLSFGIGCLIDDNDNILPISYLQLDDAYSSWEDFKKLCDRNPNVLFVVAAGNNGEKAVDSPAYYAKYCKNLIAVGATDNNDYYWSNTNRGSVITLYAPGKDVRTTNVYISEKDEKYKTESGTSLSTPMVAGAAALLKSANHDLTAEQIKNILVATADTIHPDISDKSKTVKRLNIGAAVEAATATITTDGANWFGTSILITDHCINVKTTQKPDDTKIDVTWKSLNENIATIDTNGKITAHTSGKFTIQATAKQTGITVQRDFEVGSILGGIWYIKECEQRIITMNVGERISLNPEEVNSLQMAALTAEVENAYPAFAAAATDDAVQDSEVPPFTSSEDAAQEGEIPPLTASSPPSYYSWKSSNTNVAVVDSDGWLTAVGPGEAEITMSFLGVEVSSVIVHVNGAAGPDPTISPTTTLTPTPTATSTKIPTPTPTAPPSSALQGPVFITSTAPVQFTCSNIPDKTTIVWTSSKDWVGAITGWKGNTCTFTPRSNGKTTIKVMRSDGNTKLWKGATLEITVELHATGFSISCNPSPYIEKGATVQLSATPTPAGSIDTVTWSSDNPSIASVNGNGLVSGLSVGHTYIYARSNINPDIYSRAYITVEPVKPKTLTLSMFSVTGSGLLTSDTFSVGTPVYVQVAVGPEDTANKAVTWSLSPEDSGEITVLSAQTITVTPKKAGTATITAKANADNKVTASRTLFFTQPVTSITLSGKDTLIIGETAELEAVVFPEDATEKLLFWDSGNTTVATVDENGVVTAIAEGTAKITAAAADGSGVSASKTITVNPKYVTEIRIIGANSLNVGDTTTLTAEVLRGTMLSFDCEWSSNNTKVATVDKNTGVVTGISEGTVKIRASALDESGVYTDHEITVNPRPYVPVSKVKIVGTVPKPMNIGDTATLTASVLPAGATYPAVTWTSDNESVAKVNNGKITAVGNGAATITATADGVSDSVTVYAGYITVTDIVPVNGKFPEVMVVGEAQSVPLKVEPEFATNQEILWGSNNRDIVTTSNGTTLTAHQAGTTSITVVNSDGIRKTYPITVIEPDTSYDGLSISGPDSVAEWDTIQLNAVIPDGTGKTVMWTSNNMSAAIIDRAGHVIGSHPGNVLITITVDGKSVGKTVTINPAENKEFLNGISLERYNGASISKSGEFFLDGTTGKAVVDSVTGIPLALYQYSPDPGSEIYYGRAGQMLIR